MPAQERIMAPVERNEPKPDTPPQTPEECINPTHMPPETQQPVRQFPNLSLDVVDMSEESNSDVSSIENLSPCQQLAVEPSISKVCSQCLRCSLEYC